MSIRSDFEAWQLQYLSPYACPSIKSRGRIRHEEECPIRNAFHRDRNRIVYSKAFRRLKHKTQVFLAPSGDHFRTRLTHTLEVTEIARTLARSMRLNEDLVDAIALGHDLGHTPFGHAGEKVLDELMPGGFSHYSQSIRVVDVLENKGEGLNLTYEVRDGIAKHSKGYGEVIPSRNKDMPETAEGCVVRYADIIAYLAHDLDDAIRSGVITAADIPRDCEQVLGDTHADRVMRMIHGVVSATHPDGDSLAFAIDTETGEAMQMLRQFLFDRVYRSPQVHGQFVKAFKILREIFSFCMENQDFLRQRMGTFAMNVSMERRVCDFVASMTDRYALTLHREIFEPRSLV